MKYITFILILCSTTLFSQGITIGPGETVTFGAIVSFIDTSTAPTTKVVAGKGVRLRDLPNGDVIAEVDTVYYNPQDTTKTLDFDFSKQFMIEGRYPKFEYPEFRRTAGAVHADMKYHAPVILDNNGWLQGVSAGRVHKDTLFTTGKLYGPSINEPGEMIPMPGVSGQVRMSDGISSRWVYLPPAPVDLDSIPVTKYIEKYASNLYSTWVDSSYIDTIGWITLTGDSVKFVRDIQLPQAWQDSTEWDAPYDPNLYFHKNHEWVYSEFDDLNQEYQKLHPYPLGGFEHEGRICKVCKTKQQRTKYYGVGKNPFKKIITNSPYSQLLLQSRQ